MNNTKHLPSLHDCPKPSSDTNKPKPHLSRTNLYKTLWIMGTCQVCYGEFSQLRHSPAECTDREGRLVDHKKKGERACQECWEVHLSNEVEEKAAEEIECLFCHSKISEGEVKSLAWAGTYRRYKWKVEDRHFQRCQDRCAASRILDKDGKPVRNSEDEGFSYNFRLQEHDREADGNLFACEDCGFETCVDCDRPRHDGEACSALQSRLGLLHPLPEVHERVKGHAVGVCPGCNSYFIVVEGCGYTACTACKYRFCEICMLPWVGEGGGYLLGPMAHGYRRDGRDCKYRSREYPSAHTIKNRFVGQREAFRAHKERRKQKPVDRPRPNQQTKRRKRNAEASSMDAEKAKESKRSKA